MTVSPTRRQLDLLRYIAGHIEVGGCAPSLNEMQAGIGLNSRSGIVRLMDGCQERGLLRKRYNRPRATELLTVPAIPRAPDGQPLYYIPIRSTPPPGQGE